MLKLASFYKKHCEWINYALLLVAVIFSNLYYYAAFAVIALIVCFAFFYSCEKLVRLSFVMYTIKMAILPGLFCYVMAFVVFMLIKNLVFECLKNGHKLSYSVLIAVVVFLIYGTISHIQTQYKKEVYYFIFMLDVLMLYVLYELRNKIDIFKAIKVLAVALVITGLICVILGPNTRFELYNIHSKNGYFKIYGLTENPNFYGMGMILTIAGLLTGFYFNKYSLPTMLSYFIPCFLMGYLTISRNYIISVAVALVVFGLCYLKKHGIKAFELLVPMCALVCAMMLLFETETILYFNRGFIDYEFDSLTKLEGLTPEEYELIFAGKLKSNPGRLGIWQNYFKCIFRTPFYVLFGVGLSAVQVGCIHAHNGYIYWFYRFGLVGLAILGLILFLMLKKSGVIRKQNKSICLFLIMFIVPIFIMLLFDVCDMVNIALLVIILGLNNLNDFEESKTCIDDKHQMEGMLLKKSSNFWIF